MRSPPHAVEWSRKDAAALAAVALLACALHAPFLLQGRIPLNTDWLTWRFKPWKGQWDAGPPHNAELDDPAVLHYPLWLAARRIMRQGHWPLWNPDILCGVPLLADTMCNPFDPVNLLTLPLPDDLAWALLILTHFLIAGAGAYVYLRSHALRRPACVAGAAAVMLNGFFIVWMELKFVVACYAWTFWLFWAADRAAAGRKLRWAGLAGAFYACAVLGGNLHHVLNFTIFVAGYLAFRAGCVWRDEGLARAREAAAALALGIAFGACLSAPQWTTTYELVGLCSRSAAKYRLGNALHPFELIAALAPKFFGHPADHALYTVPWFGRSYLTMNAPYVGAFAAVFAVAGAFAARREARFFAAAWAAVIGFLLLLGVPWAHRALAAVAPIDTLDHHRLLAVAALSAAMLVAWGMDSLLRGDGGRAAQRVGAAALAAVGLTAVAALAVRWRWGDAPPPAGWLRFGGPRGLRALVDYLRLLQQGRVLFIFNPWVGWSLLSLAAGGACVLWFARGRAGAAAAWLAAAAVAVELLYFGAQYNPFVPRRLVYPETPAIRFLQAHAAGARILGVESPRADRWKGDVIPPSSGLCYGLADVRGKEGMMPRRTRVFFEALRRRPDVRFVALVHFCQIDSPLFDLLGARYVASSRRLNKPHLKLVYEGELFIYENERSLPRAFACPRALVFSNDAALGAYLLRPDFDPRRVVLLDAPPARAADASTTGGGSKVSIRRAEPNRVEISVDAPGDCYLVLADADYPGWRAFIDGRRVRIQNADYLLRCVSVPAGRHEVVFDYWPASFQCGLALCAAAACAALALAAAAAARRRRRRSAGLS